MRKLQIGIINIVSKGPPRALYARLMNPNLASIMPQVIGVWCREEGHDVSLPRISSCEVGLLLMACMIFGVGLAERGHI